ncbi:hypothetical protein BX616_008018, partial [Lobosporangium transversale]
MSMPHSSRLNLYFHPSVLPSSSYRIIIVFVTFALYFLIKITPNHSPRSSAVQGSWTKAHSVLESGKAEAVVTIPPLSESSVRPAFGTPSREPHWSSSSSSSRSSSKHYQYHRRPRIFHRSPIDQLYEDLNAYTSEQDYYRDISSSNYHVVGWDCAGYYCAETDTCVDKPISCPCPSELDTKCVHGD